MYITPDIDKYSDNIIYFCFLNSNNKCTNIDELTKLSISHETGIITGKLNYFGTFSLKIFAKTYFQYKINTYSNLYSYCGISQEYNKTKSTCESCPIGTFWNSEKLLCENCQKYIENTSTLKNGSKLKTDCLCSPGYEYSDKSSKCEKCKPGYYKKSVGNFICIKGCPINEKSITYGAKSYAEMDCKCIEGYYRKEDKCVLCLSNYYCPGNELIKPCDKNKISKEGVIHKNDCICKENYIKDNKNNNCVYCASIAKILGKPIYCSLCDPIYFHEDIYKNIFLLPNNIHNYGLINNIYNYDEDLSLQGNIMKYAYFHKTTNIERNFTHYINIKNIYHTFNNNINNYDYLTNSKFAIEIDIPEPKKMYFL